MLLSLIVYATAISLLLGLAAWTLERAVRAVAFPTRWIWAGVMSGYFGFTLVAILWPTAASTPQAAASATPLDAIMVPVVGSLTRLADPLPSGVGLDTLLGAGWAMGMHPREQELMLRHDTEHCKAGDARLIGAALLLRILLPWNVPLWWQVHRLRAAIEIDCDRRVVHRSADVKRYAALLVEIGARRTAARWSALAFARPIPLIERRILAMTDTRSDPRYIRMIGLTLLAALFVVASCQVEQVSINIEVEQPTPDVDAIDRADRILDQSSSLEFKLILPVSELEPALPRIDRQIVGSLG